MDGVLEECYWSQPYAPVIRTGNNLTLVSADKLSEEHQMVSVWRGLEIFFNSKTKCAVPKPWVKPTSLARIASLSWLEHCTLEGETQGHLNLTWAADGLVYDP